jgi:cobalt-zinc-cadmium efflux system protein
VAYPRFIGAHDHHGHSHAHAVDGRTNTGWLMVALGINVGFFAVEVVFGLLADSVALLSDAAHMLTDAAAIGIAVAAARLATRPPSGRYTFGLRRSEILSAQTNGAALLVLAGILALEAARRLSSPPDVHGAYVIAVGLAGMVANGAAAVALSRANRASMNVEGAFLHNLADLYSSLAAAVAGILVVTTGFDRADGLAALTVCALMVVGGWRLLADSGRVLLEGTPRGMDADEIGRALAAHPGVVEVHDLHVWEVTSGFPALSAHVIVPADEDCHGRRRELQRLVEERFGIEHTTLQVDHAGRRELLTIGGTEGASKVPRRPS